MNNRLIRSRALVAAILIAPLLIAPKALNAQEVEEEGPWSGKATLGFLGTSGNTESSTLNTAAEVSYAVGNWTHIAEAFAISSTEGEITTAEAYALGWKSERSLTEHDYLFGRLDWRKDLFGGYDTQFSQTIGYGRRVFDLEKHTLNAEIGVGARQSELQSGIKENETILRAGGYYTWQFSETAEFHQDLTAESGGENTYLESYTAISAKLFGDLALVASYTIKHNTDVPLLTEETDTYSALSLEYVF